MSGMNDKNFGILAFGAYLPRGRLQRKAVAAANSWFVPGLRGIAKGERAAANWDEDAVTMAVEAARDALADPSAPKRGELAQLLLASTTHPFAERHNAAIVASALDLSGTLASADLGGGQRAGTTALGIALRGGGPTLVAAADARKALVASPQELHYGDGGAALVVGSGEPIARLLATRSETVDFVHQYRMPDRDSDYVWEERWVRDEGYLKIVPAAVKALLERHGVAAESVAHFCMPGTLPRIGPTVAKACGLPEASVRSNLAEVCGDTGAAHALLMLAAALEDAKPGEKILVAGFGEGCDVLLFEATEHIGRARAGVKAALARRREEANYLRWLSFNERIRMERGMRAEVDKATALSIHGRNREMLQGLIGGRCTQCGTFQYPRQRYCVNPECKALDSQERASFAERTGKVMSYTADSLTYSPDPPTYFGMVSFDGGGRMMMDFTEVDAANFSVGTPVRPVFRIKDADAMRGFRRYFWKAEPIPTAI
jgi:3-hydroxy-3-methylglutaryl CoA synthase